MPRKTPRRSPAAAARAAAGPGRRLAHPSGHAGRHRRGGAGQGRLRRGDHASSRSAATCAAPAGPPRPPRPHDACTRPSPCTPTRRRGSCTATPTAGPGRARGRPAATRPSTTALAEIDALAALAQVTGVGETGLDYFRTGPEGMAAQERSFRAPHRDRQAARQGPGHPRPRGPRRRAARSSTRRAPPSGPSSTATPATPRWPRICAAHGYFMSFAGNVTFKNAQPAARRARRRPAGPRPRRDRRARS